MKSREALNQLIDEIKYTHNDGKTLTDYDAKLVKVIERDLEVLEIIKTKNVFPLALMSLPYELYNGYAVLKEQQLTQEEYDKIKEYLKDDINLH